MSEKKSTVSVREDDFETVQSCVFDIEEAAADAQRLLAALRTELAFAFKHAAYEWHLVPDAVRTLVDGIDEGLKKTKDDADYASRQLTKAEMGAAA